MDYPKHIQVVGCMVSIIAITFGLLIVNAQEITPSPEDVPLYAVIYTSDPSLAYSDIYAIDISGQHITSLVTNAFAKFPIWSSAANKLAFVSLLNDGEDILSLDIKDRTVYNLTQNSDDPGSYVFPRWSPDGKHIAFAKFIDNNSEVFTMNADGSNIKNITTAPNADDGLAGLDWSPDGDQIVFTSDRNGRTGIYVMDSDGTDQHLLVSNEPPSEDKYPIWSPLEDKIAFVSHRLEGYGIYTVHVNGSAIMFHPSSSDLPGTLRYWSINWSPDGDKMVMQINTDGTVASSELYIADNDASNQVRLTNNELYDAYPSWIPTAIVKSDKFPVDLSTES